jgi:tetratricopeptide (TPR) repeat protein
MRWLWGAIGLALMGVVGCETTSADRVREYNEDGLQLFRQGTYDKAAESFEAAIALQPSDPALLFNVARCYDRTGNASKAEQEYNLCLHNAPNHAGCRNALTALLLRQGRREEATHMVEGWLASQPELAAAHTAHGVLLHQLGDLPAAKLRLEEARRLDPHDTRALVELGSVWEALGAPDRALDCYQRALDDDPHLDEVADHIHRLQAQGIKRPLPD